MKSFDPGRAKVRAAAMIITAGRPEHYRHTQAIAADAEAPADGPLFSCNLNGICVS
jgi:hypothetical protein